MTHVHLAFSFITMLTFFLMSWVGAFYTLFLWIRSPWFWTSQFIHLLYSSCSFWFILFSSWYLLYPFESSFIISISMSWYLYIWVGLFVCINEDLSLVYLGTYAYISPSLMLWLLFQERKKEKKKRKKNSFVMSVYIGSLCNKFDSHIIYIYLIYTSSYDWVVGYIPNYHILLLIYLIELLIQSLFSFILIMFVVFTRILSYHPSTLFVLPFIIVLFVWFLWTYSRVSSLSFPFLWLVHMDGCVYL